MNLLIIIMLFLSLMPLQIEEDMGEEALDTQEEYSDVENLLKIAIGAFSALLFALSISAYRKTGLKKVVYAAIAFGLFAVQLFLEYMEETVESFRLPYFDIVFYAITLAILLLFFFAIVRRK